MDSSIGNSCFFYTFSVQSSSTPICLFSSIDATALRDRICFTTPPTGLIVQNQAELSSIPRGIEELWIQPFDTTGLTSLPLDHFESLKTLVIGNTCFCGVATLELSGFPFLESIEIGKWCFFHSSCLSLTSLLSCMVAIIRSSISSGSFAGRICIQLLPHGYI